MFPLGAKGALRMGIHLGAGVKMQPVAPLAPLRAQVRGAEPTPTQSPTPPSQLTTTLFTSATENTPARWIVPPEPCCVMSVPHGLLPAASHSKPQIPPGQVMLQ